jgi:hypothetical protein
VIELAGQRIVQKKKLFTGSRLAVEDSAETVKLALLVAYEMNPFEDFQVEEEALMRGCDADTLRARKKIPGFRPL